jgi:CheY-like chemotaxis protein
MGLASSYGIVRRHKGEIFAESTPGHRTAFTVKLPLEKKSSGKGLQAPADRAQVAYRVLVIDDSEDSVWVLRNGLAREGQEVLESLSGHQGIEIFKNEQVDVVICDLGMPGLNGWEVGKALKDICLERGVPRPPFILLTGWGGLLDEKEKLLECGVDRILEKPFLVKNLLEIVQDLLEGRSQVAAESN